MDEISIKIDDLTSKKSATLKGHSQMGTLTLTLLPKKLCAYCKREQKENIFCCGTNENIINLDIKATIQHSCDVKADLGKALFNENFSDFTFIVNKERIPVSKILLAARSPVFERMFNSDFKEKNRGEQTIKPPFQKAAFKELIRYIYTNEISDLSKHVFDLLQASDYYQVEGLKAICEEELLSCLTEENANKIFQYAHACQCSSRLIAAAFILVNNIFQRMNLIVPEEFATNPIKVAKLIEKKESLEDEFENNHSNLMIFVGCSVFLVFALLAFKSHKCTVQKAIESIPESISIKNVLPMYFKPSNYLN